ncbi:hypothetical protein HHK36_019477 [Tetracentron sinense]|uniref:Sodium/calcium exchanger membrane region domain-containing protein n=1 Tax=Tetracentron sinense TaxID=13715 RepID=A0A834YTV5_TETSI|nr:hypothetical protein HHK36_019477 [Tetracentron sinense]
MASLLSISKGKDLYIFLNTSFLFLLSFYLTTHLYPSNSHLLNQSKEPTITTTHSQIIDQLNSDGCNSLHKYHNYKEKCGYVKSQKGCISGGYIDYLQLFYCTCGQYPVLGYTVLTLWLILLFYLLGNTAANYFCSSLENLSRILKLSPTIAGVTLLSLGNGAPDVFSSIVSFMGTEGGEIGLNSILGGAFFVSSTVVGIISISISSHQISVDKSSFIRDVLFFLLSLSSLLVIVILGKINLWGAIGFVSIYLVYISVVSATHIWRKKEREVNFFAVSPILPVTRTFFAHDLAESSDLETPLLGFIDQEKCVPIEKIGDQKARTRCSNLESSICYYYFGKFMYVLELPLYLPRRLTIPVVCEERWSKPFAVISVTLAPILLAVLWNSQRVDMVSKASLVIYLVGGSVGIICGILAVFTTKMSNPPEKCLFPWLAGGFLMSITWTYVIAEELVALLLSLGHVFGISPSILGLTVLAWGNSLGDLIANVAMAINGGPDGAQVAISGCYAGPMFNTLVGLGLSLVFSAWCEYPSSFVIPIDPSLYETIGFLMGGLLWALVILPKKNMKVDRFLGGGLLAIYLCFLSLRLARALGLVQLHGYSFSFSS